MQQIRNNTQQYKNTTNGQNTQIYRKYNKYAIYKHTQNRGSVTIHKTTKYCTIHNINTKYKNKNVTNTNIQHIHKYCINTQGIIQLQVQSNIHIIHNK